MINLNRDEFTMRTLANVLMWRAVNLAKFFPIDSNKPCQVVIHVTAKME